MNFQQVMINGLIVKIPMKMLLKQLVYVKMPEAVGVYCQYVLLKKC